MLYSHIPTACHSCVPITYQNANIIISIESWGVSEPIQLGIFTLALNYIYLCTSSFPHCEAHNFLSDQKCYTYLEMFLWTLRSWHWRSESTALENWKKSGIESIEKGDMIWVGLWHKRHTRGTRIILLLYKKTKQNRHTSSYCLRVWFRDACIQDLRLN